MFSELENLGGFFLILAFWFLAVPFCRKDRNGGRAVIALFTFLIALRYFLWRLFQTVLPFEGPPGETFWVWMVYLFELFAFFEISIFLLIMSRWINRSPEADLYEKEQRRPPSVDVFIPTYNEGLDVLEKSILGARHLDYPEFKVWVLDDSRRDWLKTFCEEHGVGYLRRPDNLHAKAGNLNHALCHTEGELVAVFDADFVPERNFLKRTTGFFTSCEEIGLVQTPQHFFNRDPIQRNLGLENLFPDEQRLFFDSMAPARDAWDAAFCCGSCSIMRRKALDKIGGFPTASITEDLLTTLSLLTVHYRTVYLNEILSHGMSSESLRGYFIQRARWCRGGIQCLYVPQGPLRAKGLTAMQRILFLPYSWILQPLTRLMLLAVPVVYLWFDLVPLHLPESRELMIFQFPLFLIYFLAMRWLTGKKYVPLLSSAVNIFGMFRLLPVMLSSLIKPFGTPFRVTPKRSADSGGTDWYVFFSAAGILLLTLAGVVVNLIPEYRIVHHMDFFHYVIFWASLNVLLLSLVMLLCFDAPKHRKEERFRIRESVRLGDREGKICNISLNGCKIELDSLDPSYQSGRQIVLELQGVPGGIPGRIVAVNPSEKFITVTYPDILPEQREALIVKLFTSGCDNEIHESADVSDLLAAVWKRAFGTERK